MPFRLWQMQLQQKYPVWAAADVVPKHGGSWKDLVAIAAKIEAPGVTDTCLTHTSVSLFKRFMYQELWNSGDDLSLHARSDCAEEHTDVLICVLIKASATLLLVCTLRHDHDLFHSSTVKNCMLSFICDRLIPQPKELHLHPLQLRPDLVSDFDTVLT